MAELSPYEPGTFRRFNARLVLLIGQSVSLGILLALLIVTASALFLTEFGSQALPYVYIAVAILGAAVFYGFAEILRRWTLPGLSIVTLALTALFFLLAWIGLTFTNATWISFLLMISFSLLLQMGFIILGGQAGRLFDVRQMKRLFPRVVAGFAIGFMVGGFIAALLSGFIGQTANLLLFGIVAALSMLGFLLMTDRRFHAELVQAGPARSKTASRPLWQLLAKRFVLVIVLYQMLSAMTSQLSCFSAWPSQLSFARSLDLCCRRYKTCKSVPIASIISCRNRCGSFSTSIGTLLLLWLIDIANSSRSINLGTPKIHLLRIDPLAG